MKPTLIAVAVTPGPALELRSGVPAPVEVVVVALDWAVLLPPGVVLVVPCEPACTSPPVGPAAVPFAGLPRLVELLWEAPSPLSVVFNPPAVWPDCATV